MSTPNIIDIKNLSFYYQKKSPLYSDFSITLNAGNIYGLLGKNGSGKTSLLGLISGTLFAQKGSLSTLGCTPKDRNAHMLSDIFYLPEQYNLPSFSSQRYLNLYAPFYPKFDLSDFNRYAEMLELELTKKLNQLSMGQQKKFILAFGLACNCALNLFDEPTNGLDIPSKKTFRQAIIASADESKTFVISTHQVKDIENLIDHMCMIDKGELVLDYSLETLNHALHISSVESLEGSELYSEAEGLGRFAVIRENTQHEPSSINLELLFNAAINDHQTIQQACNANANQGAQ